MATDERLAARRRARVWDAARAAGHDALIVAGRGVPGEYGMYEFVTGARPPLRPAYAVLLSPARPSVVVPSPAEAAALAGRPATVAGIGRGNAAAALAGVLASAPRLRSVGVAGLADIVPVSVRDGLRALLPPAVAVADAGGVVAGVKAEPDDAVVSGLQRAAAIAERGLRRFSSRARPGRSCRELAADVERELWLAGASAGFAYVGPGEPSSAGSPAEALADGDLVSVVIELAGPDGAWIEVGVLHAVGSLAAPDRARAEAALAALRAGEQALRPGRRAGDVARAIERTVPAAAGAHGHGAGIDSDEPVIEVGDERRLRTGAAISLHPALEQGPCVINTYVLAPDGAWPLLARPQALHTIGTTPRRTPMTAPEGQLA